MTIETEAVVRRPWFDYLNSDERAELEKIDARAVEIDAERRTLTNQRTRLCDRAMTRRRYYELRNRQNEWQR